MELLSKRDPHGVTKERNARHPQVLANVLRDEDADDGFEAFVRKVKEVRIAMYQARPPGAG